MTMRMKPAKHAKKSNHLPPTLGTQKSFRTNKKITTMTNNTKSKRETLWEEDDFFQQQSPYLQALGVNRAADTGEGETADFLYDLDLHVHDEAERLFSGFVANMKRAPTAVVRILVRARRRKMALERKPRLTSGEKNIRFLPGFEGGKAGAKKRSCTVVQLYS